MEKDEYQKEFEKKEEMKKLKIMKAVEEREKVSIDKKQEKK
jgi:hypothetical protein